MSETFIRRPIATSLLMAAIALFGVVAYRGLPISDLPTVANATINVNANLPGGDPGTMAASVASPLERQFTTIAGVDEMISSSSTGNSNITLTFDLNRNIDGAAVDVQTTIAEAMPLLPSTLTPPSFRKANLADEPIFDINLTSDTVEMLGLKVVGGLLVSQVITLYLTPVVYTYMARWVKTTTVVSAHCIWL